MQVKIKKDLYICSINKEIKKDSIMDVQEEKGGYYVCSNEELDSIFIPKEFVEVRNE